LALTYPTPVRVAFPFPVGISEADATKDEYSSHAFNGWEELLADIALVPYFVLSR